MGLSPVLLRLGLSASAWDASRAPRLVLLAGKQYSPEEKGGDRGNTQAYLSVPRAQVKGVSGAQEPQDSHLPLHSPPPEPSVAMRAHTQETRRHAAKLHPSASWFRHA